MEQTLRLAEYHSSDYCLYTLDLLVACIMLRLPLFCLQRQIKVLDFESTCEIKPKSDTKAEIIEFPVVVVQAETGQIVDEFHRYVRPTESPTISDFCKKLTGISQQTVDTSPDLKHVLKEFENWLKLKKKEFNCVFKLDSSNAAVFVTWTDWDISTCLWNECQRKHLSLPVDLLTRIDLKAVFKWCAAGQMGIKTEFQGRLQDALNAAGLTFRGRPHSGIADARNTAALLNRIISARHDLNELSLLYKLSFGKLSGPDDEGQVTKITNSELFFMGALSFIHQSCKVCGQFSFKQPYLSSFVPKFRDQTLRLRMNLGHNFYLARACHLLPRLPDFENQFSSSCNRLLTMRDLACLQRLLVPLLTRPDCSHADLMAWIIDRGIFVKDFALVFLKNATFDDALCAAKVLPRLARQVSMLTEDSDVSLALVRKLTNLRRKNLPTNHHDDLLKELVSLLTPEVKSDVLARLHEKPNECSTPLSSEDSKFRCYLRKFFNRLAAGPGPSDSKSASAFEKPWRDPRAANTISKEALIDADLLLLTRPIDFLVELMRFPIIQNSPALFPVVYKILNHVNYSFEVHVNGSGASVLRQLIIELLTLFEAETSKREEMKEVWRGEHFQRIALMRYLPQSADLDPVQVSLSAQVALFAASAFVTADDDSNDATVSTSRLRKLWIYSFVCLLDQSSTWSQLTDLVDEGVLAVRTHAEVVVQSLALLLVPRVPADLPLGFFAVPCASLLERLRTPLSVRVCVALLTARVSDASLTADAALCPLAKRLRAVLSDPKDRERRLLMQCADFLPSDLLGTVVITLPRCLIHSKLIDVAALNESLFPKDIFTVEIEYLFLDMGSNMLDSDKRDCAKNHFQFIAESPQTDNPFDRFAKPLSSCDLEEVLQLVSLCDGAWYVIVNSILTSSQAPEVRNLWNRISVPALLLALHTFLHRITLLDEVDAAERWARAIGFVDQLAAGNFIGLPFMLRSIAFSSPSAFQPHDIFLGYYRCSLDLFDFTFALLRVVDCSAVKAPVPLLHLSRVCQTLAVLGQRLVARLRGPHDIDASAQTGEAEVDALVKQAILVISEVKAYVEHHDAPAHSPLKRLSISLEIVAKSLTCQRQQRKTPEQGKES
ncbi:ERI1 exoribonuclease 2 [Taenia solium]